MYTHFIELFIDSERKGGKRMSNKRFESGVPKQQGKKYVKVYRLTKVF
jgi:hypothetical protein